MNSLHLALWQTLLIINVGLLLIGSFLEPPAAIIIFTPVLLPLVEAVGVHPIHFGIIMAVNLSIGMYTPPFGLNLFASQAIFNKPLAMIYRGVIPFVLINFATLLLISYVPWFSMGLLNIGKCGPTLVPRVRQAFCPASATENAAGQRRHSASPRPMIQVRSSAERKSSVSVKCVTVCR